MFIDFHMRDKVYYLAIASIYENGRSLRTLSTFQLDLHTKVYDVHETNQNVQRIGKAWSHDFRMTFRFRVCTPNKYVYICFCSHWFVWKDNETVQNGQQNIHWNQKQKQQTGYWPNVINNNTIELCVIKNINLDLSFMFTLFTTHLHININISIRYTSTRAQRHTSQLARHVTNGNKLRFWALTHTRTVRECIRLE